MKLDENLSKQSALQKFSYAHELLDDAQRDLFWYSEANFHFLCTRGRGIAYERPRSVEHFSQKVQSLAIEVTASPTCWKK